MEKAAIDTRQEGFYRKYRRVLDVLPDVIECAQGELILVGGTALALFYLKHRVSVDLDFVPVSGDDTRLKEKLKGCLSKKGYQTIRGAFQNQFVVKFEDTSIRIEVFKPEQKVRKIEEHVFGNANVKVASLDDILRMKLSAYEDRRAARDLLDIFCILKKRGEPAESVNKTISKLVSKNGVPENLPEIEYMALHPGDAAELKKVVQNAVA